MKAIVLFGHGSRDPLWRKPMEAVQARLAASAPGTPVRCAYLELQEPDLGTAVAQLVNAGAQEVRILPMFLGAGRHVRDDLPALVRQMQEALPAVRFVLMPPIGEDDRLLDLISKIAME